MTAIRLSGVELARVVAERQGWHEFIYAGTKTPFLKQRCVDCHKRRAKGLHLGAWCTPRPDQDITLAMELWEDKLRGHTIEDTDKDGPERFEIYEAPGMADLFPPIAMGTTLAEAICRAFLIVTEGGYHK